MSAGLVLCCAAVRQQQQQDWVPNEGYPSKEKRKGRRPAVSPSTRPVRSSTRYLAISTFGLVVRIDHDRQPCEELLSLFEYLPWRSASPSLPCTQAAEVQAELQQYLNTKNINSLFISIVENLLIEKPANPIAFMIEYLYKQYPDQAKPALETLMPAGAPVAE